MTFLWGQLKGKVGPRAGLLRDVPCATQSYLLTLVVTLVVRAEGLGGAFPLSSGSILAQASPANSLISTSASSSPERLGWSHLLLPQPQQACGFNFCIRVRKAFWILPHHTEAKGFLGPSLCLDVTFSHFYCVAWVVPYWLL